VQEISALLTILISIYSDEVRNVISSVLGIFFCAIISVGHIIFKFYLFMFKFFVSFSKSLCAHVWCGVSVSQYIEVVETSYHERHYLLLFPEAQKLKINMVFLRAWGKCRKM
jgi:hypothetical protein